VLKRLLHRLDHMDLYLESMLLVVLMPGMEKMLLDWAY
jgi:hypothetical protein